MNALLRWTALSCIASLALPHAAGAEPAALDAPEAETTDAPRPAELVQAEVLYKRGRASFETANFLDAVTLWEEAYSLIDDVPQNAAIKAALIYNIAAAQEKAYDIDTDLAHLRRAKVLLGKYRHSVPALYGEGSEGAAELDKVDARIDELRARIVEAEAASPEPSPPPRERMAPEPDPSPAQAKPSKPFIIAGAVTASLGVAGLGLMAGGLAMGSGANEVPPTQSIEDRRAQFDRGRTGNTLASVGGAVGGVLLVGGAVLLGIGLARRSAGTSVALAPYGGPDGAGASLAGRF